MKSSIIFVPVIFVVFILALVLPRAGRLESTPAEILPSTSYLPTAEPVETTIKVIGSSITLEAAPADSDSFPAVDDFAAPLLNGIAEDTVGVYVPGVFALPVMQQPKDQPAFVSSSNNILTQFALPKQYGTTGLLAHNYLSGSLFYELETGDVVVTISGDGGQRQFRIERVQRFQALNPLSPYSQFIDLENPGKVLSSAELFSRIYTQSNKLIFQTCIDADGDPSWGRIFIVAEPVEGIQTNFPAADQYASNN